MRTCEHANTQTGRTGGIAGLEKKGRRGRVLAACLLRDRGRILQEPGKQEHGTPAAWGIPLSPAMNPTIWFAQKPMKVIIYPRVLLAASAKSARQNFGHA